VTNKQKKTGLKKIFSELRLKLQRNKSNKTKFILGKVQLKCVFITDLATQQKSQQPIVEVREQLKLSAVMAVSGRHRCLIQNRAAERSGSPPTPASFFTR